MRERGDRLRLALEPRARDPASAANGWRQDLDRDVAVEPGVAGAIDLAHAARAERAEDLVRAEASRPGLSAIGYFRDGRAAAGRGSGRAAACVRP